MKNFAKNKYQFFLNGPILKENLLRFECYNYKEIMELEKQPVNTKIVTRNALLYRSYLAFVHFNVLINGFRIGIQNIDFKKIRYFMTF